MTPQEQRECDLMIEAIKESLHVDKGDLFDILSMIVDSQDIKQSLEDYVNENDIEWESEA